MLQSLMPLHVVVAQRIAILDAAIAEPDMRATITLAGAALLSGYVVEMESKGWGWVSLHTGGQILSYSGELIFGL